MMERMREAFDLYREHGHHGYIGGVSCLDHARQAGRCAEETYDEDLRTGFMKDNEYTDNILAAFFHDIGHLVRYIRSDDLELMGVDGDLGVMNHEKIGADYLRLLGFSSRVCNLVGGHVRAKRYLVTIDQDYKNNLSETSKHTLEIQGGEMSNDEKTAFENDPDFCELLDLRQFDEDAKNSDPRFLAEMDTYYPISYFESLL